MLTAFHRSLSAGSRFFCVLLLLSVTLLGSARADDPPPSAYRRHIVHDGGVSYYIVGPRAPHLFMVSRDLYGDEHRWKEIAQWNDLKAPYTLTFGQRLIIKAESTLTDAQADHQLVVAFSSLQRWDSVERIILSGKKDDAEVTTIAVAAPPPVAKPEIKPETKPETQEELKKDKSEVIEAAPLREEKVTAHEEKAEEPQKRWSLTIAPLISVARLHSEFQSSNTVTNLYTDIDYGADADIGLRVGDRDEISFGFGAEHMDVKAPKGGQDIEGDSQNLAHLSIGLRHELNHASTLRVFLIEDQEAFGRPTPASAEIITMYIPQLSVGGEFKVIHHPRFGLALTADGLLLLPSKKDEFDFEIGYGATLGLHFENEFTRGKLVYGLSARYLNQDATHIKTYQEMALANLGWEF